MRSILVPVEDSSSLGTQLQAAAIIADRFKCHIDGTAPRWRIDLDPTVGDIVVLPVVEPAGFSNCDQAARISAAERTFRDFVGSHGITWGDPLTPSSHPTANWLTPNSSGDEKIGKLARLYDLTVLPRPTVNLATPREALLDAVLIESGRPILLTPPVMPAELGQTVLIAWNGSKEAARAIAFAKPFLVGAQRVVILNMMSAGVDLGMSDLGCVLARMGIRAETVSVYVSGRRAGEAILNQAAIDGADLIVKGAYTQGRLSQLFFGGATSHLVREATVPVLMTS